jgi:hypothetical protein
MQKKFFIAIKISTALTISLLFGTNLPGTVRSASQAEQVQTPSTAGIEFFERRIRPAMIEHCYGCHSAQTPKPKAGLRLDSRESMLTGGASGQAVITPGNPDQSLLIRAIRYTDPKLQMPPLGRLPDQVIRDFEEWIKMGAPDPRRADAPSASTWSPYDFTEAKKFRSFQPVKDTPPPQPKSSAWLRSPIDNFILAKLEEKNLKPVGDADKRTLLRRATFDLTGLPPTPEEIEAFISDKSANAFEKVIDRLLASPAYGEKWGRHWLDVVRYADTAGDNSDYPVLSAYRYRNYVIESFNRDKPYDQFIREQIAGDLLPSKTEAEKFERIIATGYLAISRRFGSRNESMNLTLDDTIDNLGKAFLGLSTSCARCHDHKFDPIPMRDYYALYGIFNSTRYAFPGAEIYKHPAEMTALASGKKAEAFYKYQKELAALDDRHEFLTAEKGFAARNKSLKEKQAKEAARATTDNQTAAAKTEPKDESREQKKISDYELKPADYNRDSDNWSRAGKTTRLPEEVEAEMKQVKARILELHASPVTVDKAYAVYEGLPASARIHRKGEPKNLGDEVPRSFLTILGGQKIPADHKGSGRDLLAAWIADLKNPLTARVMVNRLWQYHFGKGLVQTPNDFGARGKAPTHPELLDYLATRFMESGWSVKKMHKLIMLSHTYQLASADEPKNAAIDVSNDYLWRFNRRRLTAEELRDAILAVSGTLDRTMGEAHPFPPESTWRFTQHEQFFATYETSRRSVYLMQQRLKKHPFFEVFDGADQNATTDQRQSSTTPVQALWLMNSPLMHTEADHFAVRVGMAFDTLRERIDYAFRLALARPARPEEIREATAYLQQARQELQAVNIPAEKLNRAALASYLRVMLSSNEFMYVD